MSDGLTRKDAVTVGDLRKAIQLLSDDHPILVEGYEFDKYDLIRAFAIGLRTDDPGLILQVRPVGVRPPDTSWVEMEDPRTRRPV